MYLSASGYWSIKVSLTSNCLWPSENTSIVVSISSKWVAMGNDWLFRNTKARPSPCNSGQLYRASSALRPLWNCLWLLLKSNHPSTSSAVCAFLHCSYFSRKYTLIYFCHPTLWIMVHSQGTYSETFCRVNSTNVYYYSQNSNEFPLSPRNHLAVVCLSKWLWP